MSKNKEKEKKAPENEPVTDEEKEAVQQNSPDSQEGAKDAEETVCKELDQMKEELKKQQNGKSVPSTLTLPPTRSRPSFLSRTASNTP